MKFALYVVGLLFLSQEAVAYKKVHRPKVKETTSEEVKPWIRTIYESQVEIVTPTVIAGVTFSGRPAPTPDPLEPWVSLKKDGTPQTIKPELKNGRTKKGRPEYSTYFKTLSVMTYSFEDLKAHNMDPVSYTHLDVYKRQD